MRSWLALPVLAAVCWLVMGAADYYARVPLNSPAYPDLQTLSTAGLLPEWQGPQYALLRLEIAMLLQSALPKYYERQDRGHAADAQTDTAVQRLTKEFKPELVGLGIELRDAHGAALSAGGGPPPPTVDTADDPPPDAEPAVPAEVMLEVSQAAPAEVRPAKPTAAPKPRPAAADIPQVVAMPQPAKPQAARPQPPAVTDVVVTSAPASPPQSAPRPPANAPPAEQEQPWQPATAGHPAAIPAGGASAYDVNTLLSQRESQLSNIAASVDRSGHPALEDFTVQDDELTPVRPYHEELPVDVRAFGDLRAQAYWRATRQPGSSNTAAGLRGYWGDAGLDFGHEAWTARLAVNYNDGSRQLKLHELWAQYRNDSGMYARAGRVILPFAERKGQFPTFSSARELGFSSVNGAGIGWNRPDWGGSVWLYDAGSGGTGSGSANLSEFALSLKLFHADDEDDSSGWRVALAYLSELGGSEHQLAAGPLTKAVPGLNLAAGWDWDCGRYHVNLDYTGALERFAAGDLDANTDGRGDQPQALNLELLYTPEQDLLYGLRFQHTTGYAGAAANRWSALYGRWLSEQLLARLELSRGQYNDYTPGKRHDVGVTADLRLVF